MSSFRKDVAARQGSGLSYQGDNQGDFRPDYLDRMSDEASFAAFTRDDETNPLVSAETLQESGSLLDFSTFAQEYPEKLFPLLAQLRPESKELFIEYYILHKSQSFLAKTRGCIQTRIWQQLRVLEQAIGAMIVLGVAPSSDVLSSILRKAGLERTPHGSLGKMIVLYAQTKSYADVAEEFDTPTPVIRKLFRPAIKTLIAAKDLKTMSVGCYLRNLTHQASLTKTGVSKRYIARMERIRVLSFDAPEPNDSPLISYGDVARRLQDMPWSMMEISSEHRTSTVLPLLRRYAKKIFVRHPTQIFMPLDSNGDLLLGYILVRSTHPRFTTALTRLRGVSWCSARYSSQGAFVDEIHVPNADVQRMIAAHIKPPIKARCDDFVEVLTGEAAHYWGTVVKHTSQRVVVEVKFPSGRQFVISAKPESVRVLPNVPKSKRNFWGALESN